MKHLFVFLSRVIELLIVAVLTYILPALGVLMVTFNTKVFVEIIHHPAYGAVMFFICFSSIMYYISWKINRIKKHSEEA
jgi:hypothetical protein